MAESTAERRRAAEEGTERRRGERRATPKSATKGSGLSAKWHGLPIYVWAIGGAAGAYLLYRWYQNRSASSTTAAATPATGASVPTSGLGYAGTGSSGGGGGGFPFAPYAPSGLTTQTPTPTPQPAPAPAVGTSTPLYSPAAAPAPSVSTGTHNTPLATSTAVQQPGTSVSPRFNVMNYTPVKGGFNPAAARAGDYYYVNNAGQYQQYVGGKSHLQSGTVLYNRTPTGVVAA